MTSITAHIRFLLLTAAALAVAAPALAQQPDPDADIQRTLRELNSDVDYGAIYRGEQGNGTQSAPGAGSGSGTQRTYRDPGQTRDSAIEQDLEATGSRNSLSEQQRLLETIREADRIGQ